MELRPGYKMTEVGVIPEDWEVFSLDAITTQIGDGLHGTPIYAPNGDYSFINGNNLNTGKIVITADTQKVDSSEFAKHRKPLSDRSILMSINGTIGNLGLFDNEPVMLGKSVAYLNVKPRVSKEFVYHSLQTHGVRQQFFDGLTGSTIGNLGLTTIRLAKIPLPPTETEQSAIAQALSNVDALLATLDQVIAKKRGLKLAAMQQLLTGQTRLLGFSGDWDEKRLGQVLTICHGKSQRDVEVIDGAYPILATGGQIGTALRPLYDKPSVLIGRKGTINQPQYMDEPFWTVDTLFYSVVKYENSAKFLYYRFCLIDWMQYNEASGVPSLNARTIESIEIACPEPAEQAEIADVLSEMDAELIALESRRDKTHNIKQAMMQELLTGKTRLIAKEENHV